MNIVEMRIWKIRDLALALAIYGAAFITAAFNPYWHVVGMVVLVGLGTLTVVHDPKGAATLRGLVKWDALRARFSNGAEPDLFWVAVWLFVFWTLFPVTQWLVFSRAWLQRDRQREAWRNAAEAWLSAFEQEAKTFTNPSLDPANDGATNSTPHKSGL